MSFAKVKSFERKHLASKNIQFHRYGDVNAANVREDVKLAAVLRSIDEKYEKNMLTLRTRLHNMKELATEVRSDSSSGQRKSAMDNFTSISIQSEPLHMRTTVPENTPVAMTHRSILFNDETTDLGTKKLGTLKKYSMPSRRLPIAATKYYRQSSESNSHLDKSNDKSGSPEADKNRMPTLSYTIRSNNDHSKIIFNQPEGSHGRTFSPGINGPFLPTVRKSKRLIYTINSHDNKSGKFGSKEKQLTKHKKLENSTNTEPVMNFEQQLKEARKLLRQSLPPRLPPLVLKDQKSQRSLRIFKKDEVKDNVLHRKGQSIPDEIKAVRKANLPT